MNIPFVSFSNDELEGAEPLGETITCPHCSKVHIVLYGEEILKDGTKISSTKIAFYKCGESTYLCGIDGKRI